MSALGKEPCGSPWKILKLNIVLTPAIVLVCSSAHICGRHVA
jgi:hypothetical protein